MKVKLVYEPFYPPFTGVILAWGFLTEKSNLLYVQ